jgi:hypothetical protein
MSVTCGTNDKLHPTRALRRGLGRDGRLGRHLSVSPEPHDVIKAPNPLSLLPPRAEGHVEPSGKTVSHGTPPTMAPAPADETDVTVHSQQEHGNHALTQYDPGHSTTMTSIPLQRRG